MAHSLLLERITGDATPTLSDHDLFKGVRRVAARETPPAAKPQPKRGSQEHGHYYCEQQSLVNRARLRSIARAHQVRTGRWVGLDDRGCLRHRRRRARALRMDSDRRRHAGQKHERGSGDFHTHSPTRECHPRPDEWTSSARVRRCAVTDARGPGGYKGLSKAQGVGGWWAAKQITWICTFYSYDLEYDQYMYMYILCILLCALYM